MWDQLVAEEVPPQVTRLQLCTQASCLEAPSKSRLAIIAHLALACTRPSSPQLGALTRPRAAIWPAFLMLASFRPHLPRILLCSLSMEHRALTTVRTISLMLRTMPQAVFNLKCPNLVSQVSLKGACHERASLAKTSPICLASLATKALVSQARTPLHKTKTHLVTVQPTKPPR